MLAHFQEASTAPNPFNYQVWIAYGAFAAIEWQVYVCAATVFDMVQKSSEELDAVKPSQYLARRTGRMLGALTGAASTWLV